LRKRTIYSPEYEVLLEMLREEAKRRKFTQEEIAKRLGMTPSIFSKYARGQLRLDVIQLRDWCTALNISFARFARDFDRRLLPPS
jgi:transcriptional regulator with XRE-family HTH domain